jgi:uncharacterized protein with ACT and thioredoxin-like domain
MPLAGEAQHAREIRDLSATTRIAILRRIKSLAGSSNAVAIEHLAAAYALVLGMGSPSGSVSPVVDLRSFQESGLRPM